MAEPFRVTLPLRFGDCDPAGIAYYPRLFALCDAAVEDWTAQMLVPRRELHLDRGLALPTVDLHANFVAVSRLGDLLDIAVSVTDLGRTSVYLSADASCAGEDRFHITYKQVLVRIADTRPLAWPEAWRTRLEAAL